MQKKKSIVLSNGTQDGNRWSILFRVNCDGSVNVKRRQLGFIPLNECFPNAHAHHIDTEHIIYIPEELHRSIPHNLNTGKGMEEINAKAYDFLGLQLEAETIRQINEIQAQSN